jgi:hypothetical protein
MKLQNIRGHCVAITRNSITEVEVKLEVEHDDQRKETLVLTTGDLVSPYSFEKLEEAKNLLHQGQNVQLDIAFHPHNLHIVIVRSASSDRHSGDARLGHGLDKECIEYMI